MIQPIVEGHGEVAAVPELLRRLLSEAKAWDLEVARPFRLHRDQFFDEASLRPYVRRAILEGCSAIVAIVDGDHDGDCPGLQGPQILQWIRSESGKPTMVTMAYREYEGWFLAAIESLRGIRGIRDDATSHLDPESVRGAKAQVQSRMMSGRVYKETVDQVALTASLNFPMAYAACRSFQHLVCGFAGLLGELGHPIEPWPPEDWNVVECERH